VSGFLGCIGDRALDLWWTIVRYVWRLLLVPNTEGQKWFQISPGTENGPWCSSQPQFGRLTLRSILTYFAQADGRMEYFVGISSIRAAMVL